MASNDFQNILNDSEFMSKARSYWTQILSGENKENTLYGYTANSLCESGEVSICKVRIPDSLSQWFLKLSNGSDRRLAMVLLAGVFTLLYKYTGMTAPVIICPVEKQNAEGKLINSILPLKCGMEGNLSFKELIIKMRTVLYEAEEHQNYPVEDLMEKLNINSGLFGIAFVLRNIHDKEYIKHLDSQLIFSFKKTDNKIEAELEYLNYKYEAAYIEQIAGHLLQIFSEAEKNINLELDCIGMLSEREKDRLLREFNNTSYERTGFKAISEMFEEQAQINPDAPALILDGEKMTYRQLNSAANRLARYIRKTANGENPIIAIVLERSFDMIIAVIAVLKAGGAYLPVDPKYPLQRISYMLEDSGAELMISGEYLTENAGLDIRVIHIENTEIAALDEDNIQIKINAEDLAYIIYTSGTTGKPKGVAIEQRNITNTIAWRKKEYAMACSDVALQMFSYSFDGFLTSFFTPIVSGAAVVLLNEDDSRNPVSISRIIGKYGITHFICVPTLYSAILECLAPEEAKTIKIVTLAGEAVTEKVIEKSKSINSNIEIVNEYGPTENCVASTILRNVQSAGKITIGKPIDNTEVYILNGKQLLPAGVAGEICLGGEGLARGYINKPGLTAEKFCGNPFYPGKRIYRTGDLARWLPDGNIEFIGRIDEQVKIRGFRIETEEIKRKLLECKQVKDAVVTAKDGKNQNKYLCAYIVSDKDFSVEKLRAQLSDELPGYMLPSYFVRIDKIPFTLNGKIDRNALPEPDRNNDSGLEYVAPRNETEERLAEAWKHVLEVERVGINDDFFVLGGDSIKTIQIAAQLKKHGLLLEVKDIFEHPNISELSEYVIRESSRKSAEGKINRALPQLEDVSNIDNHTLTSDEFDCIMQKYGCKLEKAYPLSPMQEGMLVLSLLNAEEDIYYEQVELIVEGNINTGFFEESFNSIVARYDIFRTVFVHTSVECPHQIVLKDRKADIHYEDLSGQNEEFIRSYIDKYKDGNRRRGFDLTKDIMMRFSVIKTAEGAYSVLWEFHHIIIDGWGKEVILKELFSMYESLLKGERLYFEEAPAYGAYINWLEDQDKNEARNYWKKYIKGYENGNLLKQHGSPESKTDHVQESFVFNISEDTSYKSAAIARSLKVTMSTLFRTVWAVLLYKLNKAEDIIFGATVSGRASEVEGIENMVGLFINTIPVRAGLEPEMSFGSLAAELQKQAVTSEKYGYYPLYAIQSESGLEQELFDHFIVYQNYPIEVNINESNQSFKIKDHINSERNAYDFSVAVTPGRELEVVFRYSPEVYESEFAERLKKYLEHIFEQIVSMPDIKIKDIEMIGEQENMEMICDFNDDDF